MGYRVMFDEAVNGPFGPDLPVQLAQAGDGELGEPIGTIENLAGKVMITHVDGTVEQATQGAEVYQGDLVKTNEIAHIGITFADDSTFALGGDGEMTLDEMVYDPASQSGNMGIQVAEGVFSFVSGAIAKTGSEAMVITTPVATIGVRGSKGDGVHRDTTMVTLGRDPDGTVGEINVNGKTLNQYNATTQATSQHLPAKDPVVLPDRVVARFYGETRDISTRQAAERQGVTPQDAPQGGGEEGPASQVPGDAQQAAAAVVGMAVGEAAFDRALAQGGDLTTAFDAAITAGSMAFTQVAEGLVSVDFAPGGGQPANIGGLIETITNDVVNRVVGNVLNGEPIADGGTPFVDPAFISQAYELNDPTVTGIVDTTIANTISATLGAIGIDPAFLGAAGLNAALLAGGDLQALADALGINISVLRSGNIVAITNAIESALGRAANIEHENQGLHLGQEDELVQTFQEQLIATTGSDYLKGGDKNTEFVMRQALVDHALPSGSLGGTDIVDGGDGIDQITFDNLQEVNGKFDGADNTLEIWDGLADPAGHGTTAGEGKVTFQNMEQIYFGSYDQSADQQFAVTFNDSGFIGYMVAGGTGNDTIGDGSTWWADGDAVLVFGGGGNDTIIGIDNVQTTGDLLYGGAGTDTITGGNGSDFLTGGTGADTFIFKSFSSTSGSDTFKDFSGSTAFAGGTGDGDKFVFDTSDLGIASIDYAEVAWDGTNLIGDIMSAATVIVLTGASGTIANAAAAISADTDVTTSHGVFIVSNSNDGNKLTMAYSTNLDDASSATIGSMATINDLTDPTVLSNLDAVDFGVQA